MAIFSNPENVLKRADELINVGQKQETLQLLHDLITSRIFRSWQKSHENIMFRYVELCVNLRRIRFAKDGLIQYRGSCQQVNVTSFEEVTKYLLRLATEKAEQALSLAEKKALDVDDLEEDKNPEDLQLSILSGEKGKDKSEGKVIWFKFLWETLRTVLEVSRNNSKFETLYAMTAHKAFQFCKQYKRTTEFRRLCDSIRNHLANLSKYSNQKDQPDLTAPETLQLYLDTRFEQLKVASELGLSQEAFRSVEDIYGLMCMVKKTPKSSLLMVYYSKLAEIFWTSSSNLYHAYAWLKLFSLQTTFNKNLNQKDLELIASSGVLAALSVPPFSRTQGASHSELENEIERNLRMANLIGFNLYPESESRDMFSKGVLSCATREVTDLYHLMAHEFECHPLALGSKMKPLLDQISKLGSKLSSAPSLPEVKLSQYVLSLEKLATLRVLKQVSKIYKTLRIKTLTQLVPFFDVSTIEKISVDAMKNNFVSMKVDHVKGAVTFENMDIEYDVLRGPLDIFAETMNKVRAMLFPSPSKASNLGDIPTLEEIVEKEHERLLARKSIIEKSKEEQEHQQLEKELQEEQKRLNLLKLTEEAEQRRLATELEERKRQRILMEVEKKDLEEAQVLLEGKRMKFLDGEMSEKLKEDEEKEKKLRKLVNVTDYLEREKREEEAPMIEAAYQQRLIEERESYEREQQREAELDREGHARDLMEKNRLVRVLGNKDIFQERVMSVRQAEKEERIGQIIQARKQEKDIKRKQLFLLKSEEERMQKVQEEVEASKLEGGEKHRKEEAERRARLDKIGETQRQRDQEVEEKARSPVETN